MTFTPAIPLSGVAGLSLLDRTASAQQAAFAASGFVERLIGYFTENIASITAAEGLVQDRQLLEVALGAFGLEDELPKRAFLRKVLEEGSGSESFANRLADTRFADFSRAFGFGDAGGVRTADPGFAQQITSAYLERQFEKRVGEQNDSLRLALNFRREMEVIATGPAAEAAGWLQVLGQPPLRTLFEGAFQLGEGFSQLPLDRQVEELRSRTQSISGDGSVTAFAQSDVRERVIARYLALTESTTQTTSRNVALQLLSNTASATAIQNILISQSQL